ncbi:MAG: hypothetical protein AAB328_04045, partial [candidate division NC10 bacterium]
MALRGGAVLAIWNDIAPGGDAEFNHWHTREHVPERVGIAGFLRGRRYEALAGSPRYFTLYEAECAADDPTDCSVKGSEAHIVRYAATAHLVGGLTLFKRVQLGA